MIFIKDWYGNLHGVEGGFSLSVEIYGEVKILNGQENDYAIGLELHDRRISGAQEEPMLIPLYTGNKRQCDALLDLVWTYLQRVPQNGARVVDMKMFLP